MFLEYFHQGGVDEEDRRRFSLAEHKAFPFKNVNLEESANIYTERSRLKYGKFVKFSSS